ncbi:CDGSH iron-sulfur domain-containing protein, putative [Hepatocystis sp. ex Piliocolobus tephrosceles]|nr:CDGSH iron-sulfur domain-containing protein, putative [Hepatocystis sp. ex Piliocolobus tephrosceles]
MGNSLLKESGTSCFRKSGEILNTQNLKPVHVEIIYPPSQKSKKISICRCWKSKKFPYCDNAHQKLQQQGIVVGPLLLEVRKKY